MTFFLPSVLLNPQEDEPHPPVPSNFLNLHPKPQLQKKPIKEGEFSFCGYMKQLFKEIGVGPECQFTMAPLEAQSNWSATRELA